MGQSQGGVSEGDAGGQILEPIILQSKWVSGYYLCGGDQRRDRTPGGRRLDRPSSRSGRYDLISWTNQ